MRVISIYPYNNDYLVEPASGLFSHPSKMTHWIQRNWNKNYPMPKEIRLCHKGWIINMSFVILVIKLFRSKGFFIMMHDSIIEPFSV
jgi:hypothetical protein